jgi:DnaJ-class molecular chaperone
MQGDHEPGKEPGDIVIQLEEREHPIFQRHGKDLTMRMDIDVSEALCGLRRPITTLDNRYACPKITGWTTGKFACPEVRNLNNFRITNC